MRTFTTLLDAIHEIRRDVYKGIPVVSSRVQQRDNLELPGRELQNYVYMIKRGIPDSRADFLDFADTFLEDTVDSEYARWLQLETLSRDYPLLWSGRKREPAESAHYALKSTIEGNHPSYTYSERLRQAVDTLSSILDQSPDSRRAYWPIFHPLDSIRALSPTRVPCSIGYHLLLRKVGEKTYLNMTYISRSVDFDTFWLTDLYLAHRFRNRVLMTLKGLRFRSEEVRPIPPAYEAGTLVHHIISFHSFKIEGSEIY